MGVRWYLLAILICICLMTGDLTCLLEEITFNVKKASLLIGILERIEQENVNLTLVMLYYLFGMIVWSRWNGSLFVLTKESVLSYNTRMHGSSLHWDHYTTTYNHMVRKKRRRGKLYFLPIADFSSSVCLSRDAHCYLCIHA